MYPIFKKEQDINAFVLVHLPSKREIFQRTGQIAVSPNGVYTGDQPVKFGQEIGERMENFVQNAEMAESLVNTPQNTSEKGTARQTVKASENE